MPVCVHEEVPLVNRAGVEEPMDGKFHVHVRVCQVREELIVRICLHVHVATSMIVG